MDKYTTGNESSQKNKFTPTIYLITPTYDRPQQLAELTRLSYTLLLVSNLHWIIVEDSRKKTEIVKKLIERTISLSKKIDNNLNITHLNIQTPKEYLLSMNEPRWSKPRGVAQRNLALDYLSLNFYESDPVGVIYFMDDDNTYDLRLFEQMRFTQKVSIWPVGLIGGLLAEGPKLDEKHKVIGFNAIWKPSRKFAIDMAGFAVSLKTFFNSNQPRFKYDLSVGMQETFFLEKMITNLEELEAKCLDGQILVWHTRTQKVRLVNKSNTV